MTTNALRCKIIGHILQADRPHLVAVADLCDEQNRIQLPPDLPEWLSVDHAADLLHRHPAHLRRLANDRFPLQVEKRRTSKRQIATFIALSAVEQIASATTRQARATQEVKRARPAACAHLTARAHPNPENIDTNTVVTAGSPQSKEPVPSKLLRAQPLVSAPPSKLSAAAPIRS